MHKILLVADVKGWIFDRHCQEIKSRLSNEFDFDIAYSRGSNVKNIAHLYDVVYLLDPMALDYPDPKNVVMGLRNQWMYEKHPQGAHGLYINGLPGYGVSIINKCRILHVVNRNMLKEFTPIIRDIPLLLVQHGVDENTFNMAKYTKSTSGHMRVGTSGRAGSPGNKRFDIVGKVCKAMGIEHVKSRYEKDRLTKEQMPEFYNNLDIYVCMSQSEGLNNPTLEAGAMGIPVVSTRCGAAEEIICNGKKGLIINPDENSLRKALEILKDEKVRNTMGENLYDEIMSRWTWGVKIHEYRAMFNKMIRMNS